MPIDRYYFNNETLEEVVTIGKKQAKVLDHVSDALMDKFKDHSEILIRLLWVKPAPISQRGSDEQSDIGKWAGNIDPNQPVAGIRMLRFIGSPTGKPMECVVRFVGEPFSFFKYSINNRSAICGNPATCPIRRKFGIEPALRFAVNLINRFDEQLYLAELPPAVFGPVSAWGKRRKMNPGGIVAVDFSIGVVNVGKCARYEVIPLERSVLTEQEQQLQRYDLAGLFTATPDEEIEERLFE